MWQQSFHPGCQKYILGVYMSSLRDVGIRSDITWRETFFEPWLKNFDLFLKTVLRVQRNIFSKRNFFRKFCFFSNSSELWTNIHRASRKSFGQNCILRVQRNIFSKRNFFRKFCFFSNSSELWTNIHRASRKSFGQG